MSTIATESRAEYFRKRRESRRTFSVVLEKNRFELLEKILLDKGITKTTWINQKIDEELKK